MPSLRNALSLEPYNETQLVEAFQALLLSLCLLSSLVTSSSRGSSHVTLTLLRTVTPITDASLSESSAVGSNPVANHST